MYLNRISMNCFKKNGKEKVNNKVQMIEESESLSISDNPRGYVIYFPSLT